MPKQAHKEQFNLSPREEEVLELASEGLTDKEIAVKVGVSLTTVRTYWERLREKTGAVNRAQSVAMYVLGRKDAAPDLPDNSMENTLLMDAALDVTVGGILILDQKGFVLEANEKAYALLNRVVGTMEGLSIEDLVDEWQKPFHFVLEASRLAELRGVFTLDAFLSRSLDTSLQATVTIRTLDAAEGRRTILCFFDAAQELEARKRGAQSENDSPS